MHIKHDKTADAIFIFLSDKRKYKKDIIVNDDLAVQVDDDGSVVSIELLNVSKHVTNPATTTYEFTDTPVPRLDDIAKDAPAN